MRQWSISAYANRLLLGLDELDWSDSLKEMQRNWIGDLQGIYFEVENHPEKLEVYYSSRYFFGVTYMTLAPEHELVSKITNTEQQKAVSDYIALVAQKSIKIVKLMPS